VALARRAGARQRRAAPSHSTSMAAAARSPAGGRTMMLLLWQRKTMLLLWLRTTMLPLWQSRCSAKRWTCGLCTVVYYCRWIGLTYATLITAHALPTWRALRPSTYDSPVAVPPQKRKSHFLRFLLGSAVESWNNQTCLLTAVEMRGGRCVSRTEQKNTTATVHGDFLL